MPSTTPYLRGPGTLSGESAAVPRSPESTSFPVARPPRRSGKSPLPRVEWKENDPRREAMAKTKRPIVAWASTSAAEMAGPQGPTENVAEETLRDSELLDAYSRAVV